MIHNKSWCLKRYISSSRVMTSSAALILKRIQTLGIGLYGLLGLLGSHQQVSKPYQWFLPATKLKSYIKSPYYCPWVVIQPSLRDIYTGRWYNITRQVVPIFAYPMPKLNLAISNRTLDNVAHRLQSTVWRQHYKGAIYILCVTYVSGLCSPPTYDSACSYLGVVCS